jgi:glycosyltransferase involved in cell wall biosynthesis
MDEVDVAAILPVYNSGSQVRQALDSLLGQTMRPAEIIVIDDGSTDVTPKILSEYEREHENVRVLTHETNQGLPTALNTAIEATDRTYIARQDADDWSAPNRIEQQYQYLSERQAIDLVGAAADVIDAQGNVQDTIYPPSNPSSVLADRNPYVHGAVMMRREAVENVGGYDPLFDNAQDYDLWVRLDRSDHKLDSMQTVLYKFERPKGFISIEQRQRRVLLGLVARADPEQKEAYRSVIRRQGVLNIYNHLSRREKAVYNRQSAEICMKRDAWLMAIREIVPAIKNDPFSARTAAFIVLSLLPTPISRRIFGQLQAF